MTADRIPSTEAGRLASKGADGYFTRWHANGCWIIDRGDCTCGLIDAILAIEAQATDGRVAALVEAAGSMEREVGRVTAGDPSLAESYIVAYMNLRYVLTNALATLATLAAERDERLRREGWDAALAAVRANWETKREWPTTVLNRLAAEGPKNV